MPELHSDRKTLLAAAKTIPGALYSKGRLGLGRWTVLERVRFAIAQLRSSSRPYTGTSMWFATLVRCADVCARTWFRRVIHPYFASVVLTVVVASLLPRDLDGIRRIPVFADTNVLCIGKLLVTSGNASVETETSRTASQLPVRFSLDPVLAKVVCFSDAHHWFLHSEDGLAVVTVDAISIGMMNVVFVVVENNTDFLVSMKPTMVFVALRIVAIRVIVELQKTAVPVSIVTVTKVASVFGSKETRHSGHEYNTVSASLASNTNEQTLHPTTQRIRSNPSLCSLTCSRP